LEHDHLRYGYSYTYKSGYIITNKKRNFGLNKEDTSLKYQKLLKDMKPLSLEI